VITIPEHIQREEDYDADDTNTVFHKIIPEHIQREEDYDWQEC